MKYVTTILILIVAGCSSQQPSIDKNEFRQAIRDGQTQVVLDALSSGYKPELKEGFPNALHEAAGFGRGELLKPLVDAGIPIDSKTGEGWTALHMSCIAGNSNVETTLALLKLGADKSIKDPNGKTALDYARLYKYHERINALEQY